VNIWGDQRTREQGGPSCPNSGALRKDVNTMSEVKSPCVEICQLDMSSDICLGCFRTMDEIAGWVDMTDAEKRDVLSLIEERQQAT
jgi:predicted Fe-S protein YdhL (DUF1289 family)